MTFGNYQYHDNAGNVWSVTVPIDFASALNMVAATTQPALDVTIQPRFANFYDSNKNLRQAVIPNLMQFGSIIGTTLTVNNDNYTCYSAVGESVILYQPQQLFLPSSPQFIVSGGSQPGTSVQAASSSLSSNKSISTSSPTTVFTGIGTGASTFLYVDVQCTCTNPNQGYAEIAAWIVDSMNNLIAFTQQYATSPSGIPANFQVNLSACAANPKNLPWAFLMQSFDTAITLNATSPDFGKGNATVANWIYS